MQTLSNGKFVIFDFKIFEVIIISENSSVGRARPCQGRGREFESRFPLKSARMVELVDTPDLKSCACMGVRVQVPLRVQSLS